MNDDFDFGHFGSGVIVTLTRVGVEVEKQTPGPFFFFSRHCKVVQTCVDHALRLLSFRLECRDGAVERFSAKKN